MNLSRIIKLYQTQMRSMIESSVISIVFESDKPTSMSIFYWSTRFKDLPTGDGKRE
jgi:hypothetical protein